MPNHHSGWLAHWDPSVEPLLQEATAESDHQSGFPEHPHMLSQPSLVNREGSKSSRGFKVGGQEFIIFLSFACCSAPGPEKCL